MKTIQSFPLPIPSIRTSSLAPDHATLENAVIALDGVGADGDASAMVGVSVLFARVINSVVFCKLVPELWNSGSPRRS
jgi:hypothetical protein